MDGTERRARLARSRLCLVLEARPRGGDPSALLDAALRGGVDVVRLQGTETTGDDDVVRAAEPFRRACDAHGALFVLTDRPGLAVRCRADGVHLGQGGVSLADARRTVGGDRLVGLSASTPHELRGDPDYFSVGAVFATATTPAAETGGLALVRAARDTLRVPWFASGGIDVDTVDDVVAHGAPGVAVVGAIRDAADAESAAATLRAALPPSSAVVTSGNVLLPQIDWLTGTNGRAAPHTHAAHADLFYVLAGTLELRVGDGTVRVPAGSCVAAPPRLVHGFRNPADEDVRYLNLHAPGVWARGRANGLAPEEFDTFGPDRASTEARPVVSAPGDGDRISKPHRLALVKVERPELDVLEYFVDAAYDGARAHVHLRHADCFHVLEGALELRAGGEAIRAEAGTTVVVPPGVVHEFTSDGRARFLNVHAPSCGFAEYLRRQDAGEEFDATRYDVVDLSAARS